MLRRGLLIAFGLMVVLLVAFLIYFPGRQTLMALTLATGVGVDGLQARVDGLEEKAIAGEPFTEAERAFLRDLYTCFAKGGKLTVVLRQSGQLMDRYLDCSGEPLQLQPRIFQGSGKVREQMERLRAEIAADLRARGQPAVDYRSPTFYMGDPAFFESYVGLYWGQIVLRAEKTNEGPLLLHWRAEMPWQWSSYASLKEKYGDYHAQCFALPNARSWLQGTRYGLRVDDGLGEYLARLGLAAPFDVWAEWAEVFDVPIE